MTIDNHRKPKLPGGFRDYPPDEFSRRDFVLEKVSVVYKSFGFQPLDTSAVEYFGALAGGDETSKQIYRLFNHQPDFSADSLALRFDLTVSLARLIAANRKSFTFPFKRYQKGEVWRGERQQKGRFKQFLQFDADIVGASNPAADAEIVMLIDGSMKALGIKNYTIKINNRKILNGFIRSLGLSEDDVNPFLRILDKLDKVGWEGVAKRLQNKKPSLRESDNDAEGMGLDGSAVSRVSQFINLPENNMKRIKALREILSGSQIALDGISEIETILSLADISGVKKNALQFEPAVARGLDYYTGPVFEAYLSDLPDLGSIMSGGRYDNLVERFSSASIPATGISLGVDRLLVGMEELGLLEKSLSQSNALIVGLGDEAELKVFEIAAMLRKSGISAEVYLGDNRSLKKQMTYANRNKISYCVIIGSEEIDRNVAQVKNMKSGEQREVEFKHLAEDIKALF